MINLYFSQLKATLYLVIFISQFIFIIGFVVKIDYRLTGEMQSEEHESPGEQHSTVQSSQPPNQPFWDCEQYWESVAPLTSVPKGTYCGSVQ